MRDSARLKRYVIRYLPYVLLFWLFGKMAGAYRLSASTDAVSKAVGALAGLGDFLSRSPLPSLHPQDIFAGLLGAAAVRAAVYFKGKNAKKFRHGVEYGSAR